jgi:hypothetical protein
LVSCGIKQLSFWSLIGNTLQKKKGTFGQTKDMTTLFSLAFSKKTEFYYTGTINGQIYIWKNNQLEEIIPNAHNGAIYAIFQLSDGFMTTGKDGCIRTWDANFTPLETIELKSILNTESAENFQNEGKRVFEYNNT